jgi:hypothetical protein
MGYRRLLSVLTYLMTPMIGAGYLLGEQPSRFAQDGIPLSWKQYGVDYKSSDGTLHHLNLKALGANPLHYDLIVWIDWMAAADDPAPHGSHMPLASAIEDVQKAFSLAPNVNLDNSMGIDLIVIVSPDPVPHKATLGTGTEESIWADFDRIKSAHFPKELEGIVHYCLFAHDISVPSLTGVSGDSRNIGAYDFIVSLGSWDNGVGNEDEQAGTFMHELGHNLGLQHGGKDSICYKPNYLSVMNYMFQTDGLRVPAGSLRFDYSHVALGDLDETDLNETLPISTAPEYRGWSTLYFCPGATNAVDPPVSVGSHIDWNCDGLFKTHVIAHVSGRDGSPSPTVLHGYDDWGHLVFIPTAGTTGLARGPVASTSARQEVSLIDANRIPVSGIEGIEAVAENGSVRISWKPSLESRVIGYKVTRLDGQAAGSHFTTERTFFIDHGALASNYEVQALYEPHGFASLFAGELNQEHWSTVEAGKRLNVDLSQAIDTKELSEFKRESDLRIAELANNAPKDTAREIEDSEWAAAAAKVRFAKVVLETKGVTVSVIK